MEDLTSVTINVTDGSVICASTVLAERQQSLASPGSLKNEIHYEVIFTGKRLHWRANPT